MGELADILLKDAPRVHLESPYEVDWSGACKENDYAPLLIRKANRYASAPKIGDKNVKK